MNEFSHAKKVWDDYRGHPFQLTRWPKPVEPNGTLVVIHHGHGEHSGRYDRLAQRFWTLGFEVASFDCRGHGQTLGRRGDAAGVEGLVEDFEAILPVLIDGCEAERVLLYGHSMGGAAVGRYLTACPVHGAVSAAILSAPALAVPRAPLDEVKLRMARSIGRFFPTLTLPSGIETHGISSDPAEVRRYEEDPLIHDKISCRLGVGLIDMGDEIIADAGRLSVPTLLYHGTDDPICSIEGSRKFARLAPSGLITFREVSGARHEIHHETGRIQDQWWSQVESWLSRHAAVSDAA